MDENPQALQQLRSLLQEYARQLGPRLVVLDAHYRVLAASDPLVPAELPPDLPEFQAAVAGREKHDVRLDAVDGSERMFVAAPIWHDDQLDGLVQVSIPMQPIDDTVNRSLRAMTLAIGAILALTIVISVWMAQRIATPLAALEAAVCELGKSGWQYVQPTGPQEVRSLANRYNEMVDHLKDLLERQKMFTANAAHELRSPLTALRLRLEMLQQNPEDRELARAYLSETLLEVEHLQRMVTQLLELAAADARPSQPATPIDLAPVLYRVADEMSPIFQARGVHLLLDVPSHLPLLCVHQIDIEIIIRNLLDNAIKYTPPDGEVWLTAQILPERVVIQVSDTGQGIAREDQARIFERFFTRDKLRRGVGLGLALVYELVVRNGGKIRLQSVPGVGTTFQILFSLKKRKES
jgi:signal transduction histidine kinase